MKKILAMLLALIMILCSLAACATQDDTDASESSSIQASTNNSSEPTTEPVKIGNLDPSINLGEKTVTILSRGHASYADEVCVDSSNGDPIDDAVIKRQSDVERTLNCTIKNVKVNESGDTADYAVIEEIKKTMGPDCEYDIVATSAYTAFENTATGFCVNLKDVAHLDLNQDYWAPYFNANATIGNAQYFATGSISLSLRRMIFVTFFNTQLAENRNIEDLYTVVNEGRWTLDYQAEILSNTHTALGGAAEDDFYGLVTDSHICVDPYWTACDVKILVKNSDDVFEFQPETEKLDAILSKIQNLYKDSRTYAFKGKPGDAEQEDIRKKFTNEEAIMATLRLIEVEAEDFRNMENYGIIPIPKFDKAQKEYYSHAHDQFIVYGIVNKEGSTNYDDLGAFLECFAIESERTVKEAYFEIALKGKYSKDQQSWDMLDKIVKNLKIDGGLLYTINLNDITQKLRNAVRDKAPTISSTVFNASQSAVMKVGLTKMLIAIETMQQQ